MELKEIWKKLETEKLEVATTTRAAEWPPKSKHPVRKLEQAFFIALIFVVFFEGIFVYLFVDSNHPLIRTFLAVVILCYVFFFVANYRTYRDIRSEIDFSRSTHQTLVSIYHKVDKSLRFQRKAAIFIYPIAASTGFLLGFATQKDPNMVIQETWLLITMIAVSLAITPFGYWLARKMEKVSYEKYCHQLKDLIRELDPAALT